MTLNTFGGEFPILELLSFDQIILLNEILKSFGQRQTSECAPFLSMLTSELISIGHGPSPRRDIDLHETNFGPFEEDHLKGETL